MMSLVTEWPYSRVAHSVGSYGNSAFLVRCSEELVGALVRLEGLDCIGVVRDVRLATYQRLLVLGDASDLHLRQDRKEKAHAASVRWAGEQTMLMHAS